MEELHHHLWGGNYPNMCPSYLSMKLYLVLGALSTGISTVCF